MYFYDLINLIWLEVGSVERAINNSHCAEETRSAHIIKFISVNRIFVRVVGVVYADCHLEYHYLSKNVQKNVHLSSARLSFQPCFLWLLYRDSSIFDAKRCPLETLRDVPLRILQCSQKQSFRQNLHHLNFATLSTSSCNLLTQMCIPVNSQNL